MATSTPFWNRPTFLLITGAGRGIGREMAIKFSSLVASNSTILLLDVLIHNLEETKKQISAENPNLDVQICNIDLSKPNPQVFDTLLMNSALKQYELCILVHNAASIRVDIPASKMENLELLHEHLMLNLYSVTVLTSCFLKLFTVGERCIVNMSSIHAIEPGKGYGIYCIGKASREMYFKALAAENPDLSILSYSPGPVNTYMLRQIAENCCFEESKKSVKSFIDNNTTVKMEETVQKLANILKSRSYSNGSHIDYLSRNT